MMNPYQKLSRAFYNRETECVAYDLLGCYLVHRYQGLEKIGKIVEVEAYLGPHDLACHSSRGKTKRTAVMFGPPGFAYIYLIYGLYYCFNVVTEAEESGAAVLIRALEPIANITERTQGPGLLSNAMGLNKTLNGHDLLSDDLFILGATESPGSIIKTARIGVQYAAAWAVKPLRFYIQGNPFVSKITS